MCYFSKLEHIADHKATNKTQSKQTSVSTHTHTLTHMHTHMHGHMRTHTPHTEWHIQRDGDRVKRIAWWFKKQLIINLKKKKRKPVCSWVDPSRSTVPDWQQDGGQAGDGVVQHGTAQRGLQCQTGWPRDLNKPARPPPHACRRPQHMVQQEQVVPVGRHSQQCCHLCSNSFRTWECDNNNNNNGHFYGAWSLARSRAQCAVQKAAEKCINTYNGQEL